ncbi:MAG: DUF7689 domain-containing protein [Candidatus Anammoxibacter sp.]
MPLKELRGIFPNLRPTTDTIKSPIDLNHNCFAYAIRDTLHWWEPYGSILPGSFPEYHWPNELPHNKLPQTLVSFFEIHGFEITDDPDHEIGVEKLALYVRDNEVTHAARQLPNGRWKSKIGNKEDILHDLDELESDIPYGYGEATIFMRRPN